MNNTLHKDKLIAIIGPTGVGKSRLAVELAFHFNGEIIGADSRQVYRYMNIGTAKPNQEDMAKVPHHLINIAEPEDDFNLAAYHTLFERTIEGVCTAGRLPFIVGGSGLYIWSVLENWDIPVVAPDRQYRQQLEERVTQFGGEELYDELKGIDPQSAVQIDSRNVRRVIRALEVNRQTGQTFSSLRRKREEQYDYLIIGLTTEREYLYKLIDRRVDQMMEAGLIEEVKSLLNTGYSFNAPALSGIGYQQICSYIKGELGLEAAIQQIKYETHRFVRQQYNWFKKNDERIHWYDVRYNDVLDKTSELIDSFIEKRQA
ncbi:MAG: tRNA (adenosine(37)-N6)-dimethylallyltransferase MiaA [Chloroflexi bacterium]|nr:tRNA (adenosine(37)-N6)-dimethylallyltransferase MiaA [Chloroflexota bacterium]